MLLHDFITFQVEIKPYLFITYRKNVLHAVCNQRFKHVTNEIRSESLQVFVNCITSRASRFDLIFLVLFDLSVVNVTFFLEEGVKFRKEIAEYDVTKKFE